MNIIIDAWSIDQATNTQKFLVSKFLYTYKYQCSYLGWNRTG